MKKQLALLTAFVLLVGCSTPRPASSQDNKKPENKATPSATDSSARAAAAMKRLRDNTLASSAEEIGLSREDAAAEIWGVMMEAAPPSGSFSTILSLRDGKASIYEDSGGGVFGGYSAREQAKRFVAEAEKHLAKMEPTKSFPYPQVGRLKFYVLTKKGVYSAEADEKELVDGQHTLSPLFLAGNDVVTRLRIASKETKPPFGKP